MTAPQNITHEKLISLLCYDADSGALRWIRSSRNVKAGALAGTVKAKDGYRYICLGGRSYLMHRVIWLYIHGRWPVGVIDHINGNKLDNRIDNLRDVSQSMNCQNRVSPRAGSASGLLGVCRFRDKWAASIKINGKSKQIGVFSDPLQAHAAYLEYKRINHPGSTI